MSLNAGCGQGSPAGQATATVADGTPALDAATQPYRLGMIEVLRVVPGAKREFGEARPAPKPRLPPQL